MNNLKENIKVSAVIAAVVAAALVIAAITNKIYERGEKQPHRVSYDTLCYPEYIEQRDSVLYEAMIDSVFMAVCEVESGRDSLARNGAYWGPSQIGPAMYQEYVKYKKSLGLPYVSREECFTWYGSRDIFVTMNEKNCTDYDIELVCKLWNPRGGREYCDRVTNVFVSMMEGGEE